ncbi:cytochrome P450 3A56-like [Brevipalpus obovatus]|uniref:cytochrome P450 3A56-like n=1 Tax=Brevipalpus obovatus TaxID=246614 RepID=UPI003D9E7B07
MIPVIIAILLLIAIVTYVHQKLTYWQRQGIATVPWHACLSLKEPFHLMDQKFCQKYGKIVGMYEGLRPSLLVSEPDLIRKILITEFDKFPNHRIFYHPNQLAGRNIVGLENEEWKKCRKVMTPLFSTGNLKRMKPAIDEGASNLIAIINQQINCGKQDQGKVVDVKKCLGFFALDVIASTVFGFKIESNQEIGNEMVDKIGSFFSRDLSFKSMLAIWFPCLMRWFDVYVFDYNILEYMDSLLRKTLEQRKCSQDPPIEHGRMSRIGRDFFSLLMESEIDAPDGSNERIKAFDINGVVDNGMLFIIAGYDTTSATLCNVIYCLAIFPEHQERLVEEIQAVSKKIGHSNLSFEQINEFHYLDAIIYETLRYLPPVPRIERRAHHDCTLDSILIPKDAIMVIPTYSLYHDPTYFPNPDKFDPQRFSHREQISSSSSVFFPFATGPRNCLGMRFAILEMKICLIQLVRAFKIECCPETKIPLDYFIGMPVASPREVKLKFSPRLHLIN